MQRKLKPLVSNSWSNLTFNPLHPALSEVSTCSGRDDLTALMETPRSSAQPCIVQDEAIRPYQEFVLHAGGRNVCYLHEI